MHGEQSQGTEVRGLPDPAGAADLPEFIALLDRLRVQSGEPSYRTLARRAGPLMRPPRIVAQSTIGAIFQPGRRRLDLDLLVAIVRALGLNEPSVDAWRGEYLRIQRDAKTGGPTGVLHQLPADLATFTGRDRQLGLLLAAASTGRTVAITAIEGMGGVGKTQLAVHAAHKLIEAGQFTDVQLYVNLRGFDPDHPPAEPAAVLEAFLRQLGVTPQHIPDALPERAAMFRDRLYGRQALVILDNAADATQVRDLIPGSPTSLVMVTSRRSLTALDQAEIVMLDVFDDGEANALLARVAGAERVAAEPEAAARIVQLCGALPLAVALAAARLRSRPTWSLQHLADRMAEGVPGVTAVFDLSYRDLPAPARHVFRLLGISPELDVTVDSVAALAAIDVDKADGILELLLDEYLLQQKAPGRFELHDLLRAYAHAQAVALDSDFDRDCALDRLLHYYAYTAQKASQVVSRFPRPEPSGPAPAHLPDLHDPHTAMSWLRVEQSNIDAAFAHACTHSLDGHTVALAMGLADILHTDGPWTRALDVHRTAAEAGERLGEPAAYANVLTNLGRVALTGEHPEADADLAKALGIYREIDDSLGEANALTDLGRIRYLFGDYPEALDALSGSLKIYREIGNRLGEANVLTDLGRVHYVTGAYADSGDALIEALAIYREIGQRNGEASILIDLGRVRCMTGEYSEAGEVLTQALVIQRKIGNRNGEANALTDLGRVRYLSGDYPEAAEVLTRALEIQRELGNGNGEANALTHLGRVRYLTGDYSEAGEVLTQALEIYRETGGRGNEGLALIHYAATMAATGDRSRAFTLYQEALATSQELSQPDDEAASLEGIADLHLAAGDVVQGSARLRQALGIYQQLGMSRDAERVQTRLAGLDAG